MKFPKLSVAATGVLLGTSGFVSGEEEGFVPFSNAQLYAQFRPRYEYADVENNAKDYAQALTARTVLGGEFSQLGGLKPLSGHLEANNVSHFGMVDDYGPEQGGYETIMDPSQTRMTQAHLTYKLGGTSFIAGRKIHTFDNQRFIGHVGWRQMPQSYDLIAVNQNVNGLSLTGAYVTRVNKITENGKLDTNSILLHGLFPFAKEFKLSAYGYMLSSIHDTFGLRAAGKTKFSGVKLSYEAEYAFQDKPSLKEESMGDIKPEHEANYYKLGFRANYTGFLFGIDYEVLGNEEGVAGTGAFNTPLATLHGMNGWADKFLKTPGNGLVDTTVTVGYINKKYGRIIALYRDFESDEGSTDFGQEFDIIYAHKLYKNLGLTLKAAFYEQGDSSTPYTDTTKYWAMLDYRFNF